VPQYNSTAGSADPGCLPSGVGCPGLIIPSGAGSDKLTNYEVGLKGRWFGGKLTTNLSAYYIDWRNLQVQASRPSDSTQFVTNIDGAVSKGIEAEISARPIRGIELGLNGTLNDAKVTSLTAEQAAVTGATLDSRLASPHLQGTVFGTYSYKLGVHTSGFTSFQAEHVGSFPVGFPYTPGAPTLPSATFDKTDEYTNINLQSGITLPRVSVTLYMENLTNSRAVTYVYPVAYTYSRYTILRPRTFGIRFGFQL
jgi:iron complex outermembrane recepter protein